MDATDAKEKGGDAAATGAEAEKKRGKAAPKADKAKSGAKRADMQVRLRGEIKSEIEHLRKTARDIARCYVNRLESRLAEILERVSAETVDDGKPASPAQREAVLRELKSLKLNPKSGKRKDLKKVETSLEKIERLLQSGQASNK